MINPNGQALYSLLHWSVSAIALMVTAYIMPGIQVGSFFSALITAAVIGLANILIWPVLMFLTLPLNIITLGLFTFVVNGAVLKICAAILPNFKIKNWGSAIFGSILLSIVSAGLHYLII